MVMVWTYTIYLVASIVLTVWVGRTLHKNGRLFLIDALGGNEKLADSLNHLLLVGFYLINVGFVTLRLKDGGEAHDARSAIEYLSTKLGIVLLVLGGMHFFNLFVLSCWRRRALRPEMYAEVLPTRRVARPERAYRDELRTMAVPLDDDERTPERGR
jgi:hypothetical protein